ncbi:TPA_asm: fusion protein [Swertia japonica amalgavirus 1]|nr:TPA_asm: fusion protein [Swertia japonica amalgavirus 1]
MAGEQRQPVAPDARVEARIDANMNQIDVFRAIFVAAGCPGAPFDTANWLRAGFTDATFLSHLRFATQFETAQELQNVLLLGRDARIFTSLLGMSNAQFYNLLSWLRSPQGQAAVTDYLALQRFARRGRGYMEATDLGWVNILEEQRQVFENERKEIRRTGDAEIAALERQLRIRRARLNTDLEAIRANHQPASSYVPLEGRQLLIASWEEYINAMAVAGEQPMPQTVTQVLKAQENYGEIAMKRHRLAFVNQGNHKEMLTTFLNNTIGRFGQTETTGPPSVSERSWRLQVSDRLLKFPLSERRLLLFRIPVGELTLTSQKMPSTRLWSSLELGPLEERRQVGIRRKPVISRVMEMRSFSPAILLDRPRLNVVVAPMVGSERGIPVSRSKWEAGFRKLIGGGEMRDWSVDSNKYRGGGCYADAMKLLAEASAEPPGRLLRDHFTIRLAREALQLPMDLPVPDGPDCCKMKNFNNEATSGPLLFSFDCKIKAGLSSHLSDFVWRRYNDYACGQIPASSLPFFAGRIGFRTKLVEMEKALRNLAAGSPIGRCVVMLDALEQAASSPLYNVLSKVASQSLTNLRSGFRNSVIRASTDWITLWDEIRKASVIVELDWKKFDRERPAEDISFVIDVVLSCFTPKSEREKRLLEAYGICMRRALVDRCFVTDDGGVIQMEGMVPSGSLWTGFLDTALNILYIDDVLLELGITRQFAVPKCCGDDNLTLFFKDPGDATLKHMRTLLNRFYRAGIDEADFFICRPPFHVTTEQAVFPEGTDLSKGTSKLLHLARWEEFEEEVIIDQDQGRSHRWRYNYYGKPKFLSCYWLPSGLPIRPAKDNLEKLLFPEGIHDHLDDYVAALLSMAVDNPFNHHNINHLKHRYILAKQVQRASLLGVDPLLVLQLSRIRPVGNEMVPFPDVAQWRRQDVWINLDTHEFTRLSAAEFSEFVAGVSSLYKRASTGGIDSYRFMDLIRGEVSVGSGQWGNDVEAWIKFIRDNPITKYLKKAKRYRGMAIKEAAHNPRFSNAIEALDAYGAWLERNSVGSSLDYALWVASRLRLRLVES